MGQLFNTIRELVTQEKYVIGQHFVTEQYDDGSGFLRDYHASILSGSVPTAENDALTLDLNEQTLRRVNHPTGQPKFRCQTVDEGTEAPPLHHSADREPRSAKGRWCRGGHSDWPKECTVRSGLGHSAGPAFGGRCSHRIELY